MATLAEWMPMVNLAFLIFLAIGGFVAYRVGFAHTTEEVQERVINALNVELNMLRDRVLATEKENARLSQIILIITTALKKWGLSVTIDGELVSISDTKTTQTSRISPESK
jgi:hypothetical protein